MSVCCVLRPIVRYYDKVCVCVRVRVRVRERVLVCACERACGLA